MTQHIATNEERTKPLVAGAIGLTENTVIKMVFIDQWHATLINWLRIGKYRTNILMRIEKINLHLELV